MSDDVVAASAGVDGVEFDPIGPVELKGLTETVSLHVAHRARTDDLDAAGAGGSR